MVSVSDQFASATMKLTKIQTVCNPADKDGNDPGSIADLPHYVCVPPFFDLTFGSTIPETVAACGPFEPGSCTVSTNPCDF